MNKEIGEIFLDHVFQLVHAKAEILHRRLEEVSKAVRLHQLNVDSEGIFLRHLRENVDPGGKTEVLPASEENTILMGKHKYK